MATDISGVVLGPPPPGIPHLKIPFEVGGDGTAVTVEQDSSEEIVQCVAMLVGTEPGTRLMEPRYGTPDPTFSGLDAHALIQSASRWEPRAAITVSSSGGNDPTIVVGVKGVS